MGHYWYYFCNSSLGAPYLQVQGNTISKPSLWPMPDWYYLDPQLSPLAPRGARPAVPVGALRFLLWPIVHHPPSPAITEPLPQRPLQPRGITALPCAACREPAAPLAAVGGTAPGAVPTAERAGGTGCLCLVLVMEVLVVCFILHTSKELLFLFPHVCLKDP